MVYRATKLYDLSAKRFGDSRTEAARYGRHLGEAHVGFPQGRPGPGGGTFVQNAEQTALYLLARSASPTALNCGRVVQAYRDLLSERQTTPEVDAADLPEPLGFIRDERHTLLEALTRLIEAARTPAGRERLAHTYEVRVYRDSVYPRAEILSVLLAPERFRVSYIPAELYADDFSRFDGHVPSERDVEFPCVFGWRTVCDLGELLEQGAERAGAPLTEARGAPHTSSLVSHRPAKAGARNGRNPRANAVNSPITTDGQSITTVARFPVSTCGGSPPSPNGGVSHERISEPPGADTAAPALGRGVRSQAP